MGKAVKGDDYGYGYKRRVSTGTTDIKHRFTISIQVVRGKGAGHEPTTPKSRLP